jgi:hypothetical protein
VPIIYPFILTVEMLSTIFWRETFKNKYPDPQPPESGLFLSGMAIERVFINGTQVSSSSGVRDQGER